MDINDEESLKKENITIDNTSKEFEDNIQKLSNLKQSIENEMLKIDQTYEKVDKEATKSFKIKREKLNKEEEDLKNKLKTEVTKIKETLDDYLSKTNNLIKSCDRIKKGINSLQKEEKNMIKTLSYLSFITKNKKDLDLVINQSMKNLKITFDEKENTIIYEEYFFNGIPKDNKLNEEGLEKEAIEMVMNEGKCSREAAIIVLRKHNGDPVEALLDVGN